MKNSNEKSKIDKMFSGLKEEMMMEEATASAELASEPQSIFMQVGRTIQCSNCHPEMNFQDYHKIMKCECICHDTPNLTPESERIPSPQITEFTEMEEWETAWNDYVDAKQDYFDYTSESDESKDILHWWSNKLSSHSQKLVSELKEKIEKLDRFRCGACDGAKCSHTQFCEFRKDVVDLLDNRK
jgi:hypothetical protein